MKRETPRYKVKRMSKLLFGDTPVWGVSDTHGAIVVYTSYIQHQVEQHCNQLNSVVCAS